MYLAQVSLLLIAQQGMADLQVSALASHWLDCANFTPTPEEIVQYKNKQLTIIRPT